VNPTEHEQKLDGAVVGIGLERFGGDLTAWWRLSHDEQIDILAHLEVLTDDPKHRVGRGSSREPSPAELNRLRELALQRRSA
jgi:hypothetical protein